MTVDNPGVIDAIGLESSTGCVVLTIADHLPWGDPQHLNALQEKLNSYLAFVESGEIFDAYPDARGRPLRIDVICKHAPDQATVLFLNRARPVMERAGVRVYMQQLQSGSESVP